MMDYLLQTRSFLLHKILVDGLETRGLLVEYCDVSISCLDSHSDGTHSLQRIHWWLSNIMLNLLWWRNKLIYILDGLKVGTFSINVYYGVYCYFKLTHKLIIVGVSLAAIYNFQLMPIHSSQMKRLLMFFSMSYLAHPPVLCCGWSIFICTNPMWKHKWLQFYIDLILPKIDLRLHAIAMNFPIALRQASSRGSNIMQD